jgi:carbonic anhydrase
VASETGEPMPFTRPASLDAALARLAEGNRRFVEERPQAPPSSAHRVELASGQSPFAVVLGCSDSRVPIETIFDQHPGNLFVIRLAGNIVNDDGLASIEYGIEVLRCMLVVVLGHSQCGAVRAALEHVRAGTIFSGHIQRIADAITPSVRRAAARDGDVWEGAVAENVRAGAQAILDRSALVRAAAAQGSVRVAGAVYELHTGEVRFLADARESHE